MSKKQKLLAGVCIPLATAGVAGAVAGILLTNKKTNPVAPTDGDYTLTYQVDQSSYFADDRVSPVQHVYANTTLDRIPQPRVESYRGSKYVFTGWKDENNNPVPGSYKITKNTKLTASFGDTTTGDFNTITFAKKPEEKDVQFSGNVSVAVKSGVTFVMVNRPTATWGDNYFQAWQTKDYNASTGQWEYNDILEGTVIRENITLYPRFTKAVSMTWDVNEADGGYLKRGSLTTRLAAGTTFDMFNQPELGNTNPVMIFSKWVDANGVDWKPTDKVNADSKAIAVYVDSKKTVDLKHHLLQFKANEEQKGITPIFAPSNTTIVAANVDAEGKITSWPKWSEITRPNVSTADGNYEVESWEFKDTDGTWKALTDDHVFTTPDKDHTMTEIRPIMKSSITDIELTGPSEVLPESFSKYTAVAIGTTKNPGVSTNFEWTLWNNETCTDPTDKNVASISSTGELTVKSITSGTELYIRTSAIAAPTVTKVHKVTVYMPYERSQLIWYHNGTQWFSLSQKGGLCDGTATSMTAKALNAAYGQSEEVIVKDAEFTKKLYIGRKLNTLYGQFGYNWTGFNAPIDFGPNLVNIESSFLENCVNFNQKLDLSKIKIIGDSFLKGCTAFGTPSTVAGKEYESLLDFGSDKTENSVLEYIGSYFLADCVNYNRDLVLPTKSAYEIEDAFLYGCTHFNRNITLPANISNIRDHFMFNCNAFTSTITVECDIVNKMVPSLNSIASAKASADIYQIGFKTAGAYGDAFAQTFPTQDKYNGYRKINTGAAAVTVDSTEYKDAVDKLVHPNDPTTLNFTMDMQMALDYNGTAMSQTSTYKFQGDYSPAANVTQPLFSQASEGVPKGWQIGHTDNKYLFTTYDEDGVTQPHQYFDPWRNTDAYDILKYQMQDLGKISMEQTTTEPKWTFNSATGKYDSPAGAFSFTMEGPIYFTGHLEFETVTIGGESKKRIKTLMLDNCTQEGFYAGLTITYMFKDWGSTKVTLREEGYTSYTDVAKYASAAGGVATAQWTQNPSSSANTITHAVCVDFSNFTAEELTHNLLSFEYTSSATPEQWVHTYNFNSGWMHLVDTETGEFQDVYINYDTTSGKYKLGAGEETMVLTNKHVLVGYFTVQFADSQFLPTARSIKSRITFTKE